MEYSKHNPKNRMHTYAYQVEEMSQKLMKMALMEDKAGFNTYAVLIETLLNQATDEYKRATTKEGS